jgi:hypothetical protein
VSSSVNNSIVVHLNFGRACKACDLLVLWDKPFRWHGTCVEISSVPTNKETR